MQQQNIIWFEDIVNNSTPLKDNDLKIFSELVSASVKANKFNPNNLSLKDSTPRIVFISIAEFTVIATVFHGQGYGLLAAFEDAFKKLQKRFDVIIPNHMIKIDIVTSVTIQKDCNKTSKYSFTYGVEGVAFAKEFDLAILPEQIAYNSLWKKRSKLLNINNLYNYLENDPPKVQNLENLFRNRQFSSYFFKASSFFLENDGLTPLYRGGRLFQNFSYDDLKNSIDMGANYLVNSILPNGRYDYKYSVSQNVSAKDYNFLRHAGTCFALAEYLEVNKDEKYLIGLKRAIKYMKLFAFPGLEDPETICFVERGLAKAGANGLAALALARYISATGDETDKDFLRRICNWLVVQTKENGDFKGHKQYYYNGSYSNKTVQYYPGEVIYGLTLSYKLLKNDSWLATAGKIANWLINVRDKGIEDINLQHDHWFLYGLNELHRLAPNPIYLDHTVKICTAIMNAQIITSEHPDYVGAHNNKGDPNSTQAATRSEGLGAAYKLLHDYNHAPEFSNKVLEYAKRSICFQLRTQYNSVNTMYVKDARKAFGGFRESLNVHSIRIDFVQHNISSLIGMLQS